MKSVVVYESWFGNTRQIAEAIAAELRRAGEVALATVDDPLPPLDGVDLVVVGAPTHAHALSSASTRRGALQRRGESRQAGRGIRGWLRSLPEADGRAAAAFDTRIDKPVFLVGSASRGIGRRLERRGHVLVSRPQSFLVVDMEGPLADGELDRARAWAATLAGALHPPAPVTAASYR